MVSDEEGAQCLAHVVVEFVEAVAPGAQEVFFAGQIKIQLAVGVHVVPRQVLHVAVSQAPYHIVVEHPADKHRHETGGVERVTGGMAKEMHWGQNSNI